MPSFIAQRDFIFNAQKQREGMKITVSQELLLEELKLGMHAKTGKPISGLLNHCIPANAVTANILAQSGITVEVPPEDEVDAEFVAGQKVINPKDMSLADIHAEFDSMGKAYDRRWKKERAEMELINARRSSGE